MRLVKRAAIMVKPRQPDIDWANALAEGGVKIGADDWPERHVYLIEDIADFEFDREAFVRPYYATIFEEELGAWHRLEADWPRARDFETFLAWFEVEIHSMVFDMLNHRLIHTERYERD